MNKTAEDDVRTDVIFDEMWHVDEQQHGESILARLYLEMVSQFPLDYMHIMCFGAAKNSTWRQRNPLHFLNSGQSQISTEIIYNFPGKRHP